MSILFLLFLLQTVPPDSEAKIPLHWESRCTADGSHCWLEKLVDFTGSQKMDRGGVAVAYDNRADQPMYVTVFVPPDVDRKKEILVHFVDSVPEGASWKLASAPTGMMRLPIMDCDVQFCAARVHPQIDNGNGTSTDFFAELKNRRLLWVLFVRNGKPERFMVPVSGIAGALEDIAPQNGGRGQRSGRKLDAQPATPHAGTSAG